MSDVGNIENPTLVEYMTEPATPARVRVFNMLAPSGFTPTPLENLDPANLGGTKEFHVEKIQGPTWKDLIKEGSTSLRTHIQIAKTVLEQMQTLMERWKILLCDRQDSNIIITDPTKIDTHTVKHIDFATAVDTGTGDFLMYGGHATLSSSEAMTAKEIAKSLVRAAESTPAGEAKNNVIQALDPWTNKTDAMITNFGLKKLEETIFPFLSSLQ